MVVNQEATHIYTELITYLSFSQEWLVADLPNPLEAPQNAC